MDIEHEIPETILLKHAPGWTLLRNLYMVNGTLLIVTSTPELFPDIALMTSTGLPAENTPESIQARMPTERDMAIITPGEARERWGVLRDGEGGGEGEKNRVFPVGGSTVCILVLVEVALAIFGSRTWLRLYMHGV